MRYFLTGATGFIGGRILQQLLQAGHEVHALVRDTSKAGHLLKPGVTLFQGNILNKGTMIQGMKNVDGVFHAAGWYKVGSGRKFEGEMINIQGTRNVLELMKELGIPKGVYTSSLAVFSDTRGKFVNENYRYSGPHLTEYDRTKWVAHYEVAEPMIRQGLPLVIVLPGLVYGPGDTSTVRTTLLQFLSRKLPMVPKGTAFCWSHVDDVAQAHVLAMQKGKIGESYIIAGSAHSFENGLKVAQQITGITPPRIKLAPGIVKTMAGAMGLIEKILPAPESYNAEALRAMAGVTYLGSNAKARLELGYNPRSLEEGLTETLLHELKLISMN